MVFLNENISFNVKLLRGNVCKVCQYLRKILEPYIEEAKIKHIEKSMEKTIQNMLSCNYFIYKKYEPKFM